MAVGDVFIQSVEAKDNIFHLALAVRRFQGHDDASEAHDAGFDCSIAESENIDGSSVRHFSKRLFGHVCFRLRERGTENSTQDANHDSFHVKSFTAAGNNNTWNTYPDHAKGGIKHINF